MIKIENIRTIEGPNHTQVRVLTDIDENIWLVAKDVAQAMGFKRTRDALYRHVPKGFRETAVIHQPGCGLRECTVLDLRGVYALAQGTRRGWHFAAWFTEALPEIPCYQGWFGGLRSGVSILKRELNNARYWEKKYEERWRTLGSEYQECKARAENAEKRLAEVLGTLQSLVGQSAASTQSEEPIEDMSAMSPQEWHKRAFWRTLATMGKSVSGGAEG